MIRLQLLHRGLKAAMNRKRNKGFILIVTRFTLKMFPGPRNWETLLTKTQQLNMLLGFKLLLKLAFVYMFIVLRSFVEYFTTTSRAALHVSQIATEDKRPLRCEFSYWRH